jgi:hypothetical protein
MGDSCKWGIEALKETHILFANDRPYTQHSPWPAFSYLLDYKSSVYKVS